MLSYMVIVALLAGEFSSSLADSYFSYTEVKETCQEESGVSDEEMKVLDKGKMAETDQGKVYVECVAKAFGLEDENGNINRTACEEINAYECIPDANSTECNMNKKAYEECCPKDFSEANGKPGGQGYALVECMVAFAPKKP